MRLLESEIDDLSVGVVFANTPASLAGWLAYQPAVVRLSGEASDDQLLDAISTAAADVVRTDRTVTILYASIAALALRYSQRGDPGAAPIDLDLMPWAAKVWTKLAKGPSTVSLVLSMPKPSPIVSVTAGSAQPIGVLLNQHGTPITLELKDRP